MTIIDWFIGHLGKHLQGLLTPKDYAIPWNNVMFSTFLGLLFVQRCHTSFELCLFVCFFSLELRVGNQCITCGVELGSKFDHPHWAAHRDPVLWLSCCGGEVRGKWAKLKCLIYCNFSCTFDSSMLPLVWCVLCCHFPHHVLSYCCLCGWLLLKYYQIVIGKWFNGIKTKLLWTNT